MSSDRARDWSGVEILSDDECTRRLERAAVGRIAFMDEGTPVVLPVNYTMDGQRVVFRTAPGSKLSAAMMQRPVGFEIDVWDAVTHSGWSVLAKGVADHVLDEAAVDRLERLPVRPWSRPDVRDQWVSILVEELTGRAVGGPGSTPV